MTSDVMRSPSPSDARLTDPRRLRALTATGLLTEKAVPGLDRLTKLAARMTGSPVALVSLLDAEHQYFVSAVGLPEPWATRRVAPAQQAYCRHVVAGDAPLCVRDGSAGDAPDEAAPESALRAYAGFPLHDTDGQPLGAFCVLDTAPRDWSPDDLEVLHDLARAAESEIALRVRHAESVLEARRTRMILDTATDAFVSANGEGRIRHWNRAAEQLFGWTAAEAVGRSMTDLIVPPRFRAAHDSGLARVARTGRSALAGQRLELAAIDRTGREFPVELTLQADTTGPDVVFHAFLHDISERQRNRAELERERTFLASLLESLETGVVACDATGEVLVVNRAMREAFVGAGGEGTAVERRLYAPDQTTPLAPEDYPLLRAAAGEMVHRAEVVARPPGLPPRRFLANAQPICSADGRQLGAVAALHDITATARAEKLRGIQLAVASGLAATHSAEQAADLTLGSVCEGLGWSYGEFWQPGEAGEPLVLAGQWRGHRDPAAGAAPSDPEMAAAVWARARQGTAIDAGEPPGVTLDGAHGRAIGLPVSSGDRVLGVLVFRTDDHPGADTELWALLDAVAAYLGRVIERYRAEELSRQLDVAHRDFDRVVTRIDDYVFTIEVLPDGGSRSIYASPNAAAIFGGDMPSAGDRFTMTGDLVHPDDREAMGAFLGRLRTTSTSDAEQSFDAEIRLIGLDGVTRWIWTRCLTRSENGRRFVDGICTDVTERHAIQAEREALLRREQKQVLELREIDRMKDELVALVTHELRTPITSVRGYLEIVLDDLQGIPPQARKFLEIVDRKAADLQQLTDDLLDLARLDAGHLTIDPRPMSLTRMLTEVITDHRPAAEAKQLTVGFDPAGDVVVQADPPRLRQVLHNLLSNAIKYTPDGGTVEVTARAEGDLVVIAVADTGIGIPPEQYPNLFERFFRSSNAVREGIKGTGLGLTITKTIVERHGGSISAAPAEPHGTVFTVTLPAPA